ncbi:hypothetical protein BY996DRAFT_6728854 [Phakopsora pachyrhizi]|nr:hypothetical protein BY996DRAFT_6728854 [Phakopsora pachyrhizi]
MSIYGDYNKTCPQTFTQGYKIIQSFSNFYVAYIPEMDKIVVVFKGPGDYDNFDWYPVSISDIVSDCQYCMTARGVKNAYLEMSRISNNFDIAKKWAKFKKVKFSVTGFGIGGCIAALSALDLGAKDEVHYSHNQGMPRCFNYAAVYKYGNLFQSLSGQSLVNKNDYRVHFMSPGPYYHVSTKAHLTGDVDQWWTNCFGNNENTTCLGDGSSHEDHYYYFTPIGSCGSSDKGF